MPLPDPALLAAADFLAGLPREERERAEQQLRQLVKAKAPVEELIEPPPVRPLREYLTMELTQAAALDTSRLLVRGELLVTVGKSGKGKTTLNLMRLLRWGAGLPLFDEEPDVLAPVDGQPLRSIIIENEGAAGMFQERMRRMIGNLPDAVQATVVDHVYVYGTGGYSGLKVDNDEHYDKIKRAVEAVEPDVVFIEPFRSIYKGDENSNTEVAIVIDRLIELATEYDLAIVLAHHEKKNTTEALDPLDYARGASALDGATATFENFRAVSGVDRRELSWSKARHAWQGAPDPMLLEYDKGTDWYHYVAEHELERRVLGYLQRADDMVTVPELEEELGVPAHRVRPVLQKLKKEGRVGTGPKPGPGEAVPWFAIDDDAPARGGLEI